MPASVPQIVVYCHCAFARVGGPRARRDVLRRALAGGAELHAVADLCELASRKDPLLTELSRRPSLTVVACAERAVRRLFEHAGSPLSGRVDFIDMRDGDPAAGFFEHPSPAYYDAVNDKLKALLDKLEKGLSGRWVPWFPVIDYEKCVGCGQCLNFCIFGVYAPDGPGGGPRVANPSRCKTNCPACARTCPKGAIIFPKHPGAPINGEDAPAGAQPDADLAAMAAGDVYEALKSRGRTPGAPANSPGVSLDSFLSAVRDKSTPPPSDKPDSARHGPT